MSLKPNFQHEDNCNFLLVLNRYFLEHGFEVSKELLKDKIKELTEYVLTIYNNHHQNPRIKEQILNKVFKPFNELKGEVFVPREGFDEIIEDESERYTIYHMFKKQFAFVGNISISIRLDRKVLDHEQQLWVYLFPDIPDWLQSIDVSSRIHLKVKNDLTKLLFLTRQNIRSNLKR